MGHYQRSLGSVGHALGPGHNADALEQKPNLMPDYLEKTPPTKEPVGLEPYLDGLRKAGPSA